MHLLRDENKNICLLWHDWFFKKRRNFIQLCFHPPFLVFGKKSIHHFAFIICNNSGVFNFIGKGNIQFSSKKRRNSPTMVMPRRLKNFEYMSFGDLFCNSFSSFVRIMIQRWLNFNFFTGLVFFAFTCCWNIFFT